MTRRYNSERRTEEKARTIRDILDAAVRLHGQGITDPQAVAREAGVSYATVRKYFPTREAMFHGCTTHFMTQHTPPSLERLAALQDPSERLRQVVAQLYALHEAALGQTWLAFRMEDESSVMRQTVAGVTGFVRQAAGLLFSGGPSYGFACAMLSPLTYRALRLDGGLSPEECVRQTVAALAHRLSLSPSAENKEESL